jgi:methyltransferase family protein
MSLEPKWIPSGDFQPLRYRPGGIGNWSAHLPFAFDLVGVVRPQLLVELGTHYGESYFGFCQSVAEHNLPCTCYAVDTWVGEQQSGFYDESVYQDVHAYNQANYSRFSYLLRETFDQAINAFADNSIDILHIDGLHTYEAVSHDFHAWLPKVKPGGVILLHDVVARHANFQVWKLWDELEPLGQRFLFAHGWGLGVFRKPLPLDAAPDLMSALFTAEPRYQDHLKRFYSLCALKLDYDGHVAAKSASATVLEAQAFPMIGGAYSFDRHARASFQSGKWQRISIGLPFGLGEGPLRLDLAEQPCLIDIAGISLRKPVRDAVVWSVNGSEVSKLQPAGDMSMLEHVNVGEFCSFISTGNDPQLFLTNVEGEIADCPMELECWVRAIVDPVSLVNELKRRIGEAAQSEAFNKLKEEHATLLEKDEAMSIEMDLLQLSHRKLQGELYVTKSDLQNARDEIEKARAAIDQGVQTREKEAQSAFDRVVHARNIEAQKCRSLEATLDKILRSRSWRITAPLRRIFGG